MRHAAAITSAMMDKYFVDEMATIIDKEKAVTHAKLSEKVENALYDEKARRKLKLPADVNPDFMDWCYTPIVQSGGQYDLKPSAQSDETTLHYGTIVCSLGLRYKNYCANVGRSFMIDPTKEQTANYQFLLDVQREAMRALKPGVTCQQVYEHCVKYVQEKRPDLAGNLVKNAGFVIGPEFRESQLVLNGKNQRRLKQGATVNLSLGFQNLEVQDAKVKDKRAKVYSLLLSDTVVVGEQEAGYLTDAPRKYKEVSFFFKVYIFGYCIGFCYSIFVLIDI